LYEKNQGLFIALAATGAVGDFAVFLFATKKRQKNNKKWKKRERN
jgi:hypothetical protein